MLYGNLTRMGKSLQNKYASKQYQEKNKLEI